MMDKFRIEDYGTPDIKIAGLQVWVHGYQFDDEGDNNDDNNWLTVSAHCGASGASVWVTGSFLQVFDITGLASDSERLYQNEVKTVEMSPLEPYLAIEIKATDRLGHFELSVEITPDHLSQEHRFVFEIDQSYLPALVAQCKKLLQTFPDRSR